MNSYAREIRKMLETLGLVRRPSSPWKAAFLTGAGLGAIAAVLLTPSNGKEVRKLVQSTAKQVAGSAEKKIAAITSTKSNGAHKHAHA